MNFEELEIVIHLSESTRPMWKVFEKQIVPWWLCNNYQLGIAEYWAWQDWPDLFKYDYKPKDIGIDGVARTKNNELWAIQVKYSESPETALGWKDVATFFGHAARPEKPVFAKRVIVTNTWEPNTTLASQIRSHRDVLWIGRSSLLESVVDWSAFQLGMSPKRIPKLPLPFQTEAVSQIIQSLRTGGRAQIHLACGTGKTLIALWVHEALRSRTTVVFLPSLSLAKQTLGEWADNRLENFRFLTVCSDETVGHDDALIEVASELGIMTTTQQDEISAFLLQESDSPKVIFSTYQSSSSIAQAQKNSQLPPFDLIIFDEAHKTATTRKGPFQLPLFDIGISAMRRLFMTATPRIYGKSVKKKLEDLDIVVSSMDDQTVYGPVVYELSFRKAIEKGLLCDYQVVVISVTCADIEKAISRRDLVNVGDITLDAANLATKVAIGKAIARFNIRKIITFHGRVYAAREFGEESNEQSLSHVLRAMGATDGKQVWSKHVSGKMSAWLRARLLAEFERQESTSIVSNARCLTEGINVPAVDGVAFIDPKKSKIDIVQAVGRAIRKPKQDSSTKERGTIILPLIISEDESADELLQSSRFSDIAEVLKALRAHDEVLSDTLDRYRTALGENKKDVSNSCREFLENHLILDLPAKWESSEITAAIEAKVIRLSTTELHEVLGILKRYISEHGWDNFTQRGAIVDGVNLGAWVGTRRKELKSGKLHSWLQAELQSIPGWSWDPVTDAYRHALGLLSNFVSKNGWEKFSQYTEIDGIQLGAWVTSRRVDYRKNKLDGWLITELEAIPGWSWNPWEDVHRQNLGILREFVIEQGLNSLRWNTIFRGINLGSWTNECKKNYKDGTLEDWLKAELNSISGFSWNPTRDIQERNFDVLRSYVQENGWARFDSKTIANGVHIGQWVGRFRALYSAGKITQWIESQLEAIPGFKWEPLSSHDATKLRNVDILRRYVAAHGWGDLHSQETILEGVRIGSWLTSVRGNHRRKRVEKWLVKELESVPGFVWDPHESGAIRYLHALRQYVLENGWERFDRKSVVGDLNLYNWVLNMRKKFAKDNLDPSLILELERLEGFTWKGPFCKEVVENHRKSRATKGHMDKLDLLRSYVNKNGWNGFTVKTVVNGIKLGVWAHVRRQAYRKGKLPIWIVKALEGVPGWTWNPRDKEGARFAAVEH